MFRTKLVDMACRLRLLDDYDYPPLNPAKSELRLLVLKPARKEQDPIRCTLRKVSLFDDPLPVYETVSYAWGDRTKLVNILIHGKPFQVSHNAARVLRRFRHRDRDRVLWIDAVCIDQGNIQERNQQVALMTDIYSCCTNVLIWLGEDNGFAERARTTIEAILEDAKSHTDDLRQFANIMYAEKGARVDTVDLNAVIDLKAFFELCASPWFTRLWVIQEAALPPRADVYCGEITIPLNPVLTSARWVRYRSLTLTDKQSELGRRLTRIWTYADKENGPHGPESRWSLPFYRLLLDLRWFDAWDPKDHVYGLLGLYKTHIAKSLPPALVPDYGKPLWTILRDATRLALQSSRTKPLAILSHLHDDRDEDAVSPSWVPSWHLSWVEKRDPNRFVEYFKADDAKEMGVDLCQAENPDILTVNGYTTGNVAHVSGVLDHAHAKRGIGRSDWLDEVRALCKTALFDDQYAIARTLVADRNHHLNYERAQQCLEGYRAWCAFRERNEYPPHTPDLDSRSTHEEVLAARYCHAMAYACSKRRFFCTSDGRIGLGPRAMRVGDAVAILYGSMWPVVLRPQDTEGHYTVLATAYLDGIMYGELVQERTTAGIDPTYFHLH